jgi:UDP-N-acetylmuramoyl-L-alanyl-D-glutamate--2,6-diaminopimelate ligase
MKSAANILSGVYILKTSGSTDISISALTLDSRKVASGGAFAAIKGHTSDGHLYIEKAIESGASLIVCEEWPAIIHENITYVLVADSSKALGIMAANFYDHPSKSLKLVGVTGTNGKTTVATLLYQLMIALEQKAGLLSTIRNLINGKEYPSTHTTGDAVSINAMLRKMVDEGCEYAFMEVSSHAAHQNRIWGLNFTGAVFTNITHDHLDYHKTFKDYIFAKKLFFDQLPSNAFALVNKDDKRADVMLQNTAAKKYGYAIRSLADFHARILENGFNGMALQVDGKELHTMLMGRFNAYNILTAYATAILLGFDQTEVLRGISILPGAQGRFDWVKSAHENVIGIVDYAHTPDALKNVLDTVREVRTGNEQLITVIGCGGERDREKRPLMALIASELSDKVILTSDNPRSEDPLEILEEMKKGVPGQHFKKVLVQADRREAIRTAVSIAHKGDILMLAGKGHETYQEIKGIKHPFDDKAILQETFMEMGK